MLKRRRILLTALLLACLAAGYSCYVPALVQPSSRLAAYSGQLSRYMQSAPGTKLPDFKAMDVHSERILTEQDLLGRWTLMPVMAGW